MTIFKFTNVLQGNHVLTCIYMGSELDKLVYVGELRLNIGEWQMFLTTMQAGVETLGSQVKLYSTGVNQICEQLEKRRLEKELMVADNFNIDVKGKI